MIFHNSGLPLVSMIDLCDPTHEVNTTYRKPFGGINMVIAEHQRLPDGSLSNVVADTSIDDCPVFTAQAATGAWIAEVGKPYQVAAFANADVVTGYETSLHPYDTAPKKTTFAVLNDEGYRYNPEFNPTLVYHKSGIPMASITDILNPESDINRARTRGLSIYMVIATDLIGVHGVISVDENTEIDDCPIFVAGGVTSPWEMEANRLTTAVTSTYMVPTFEESLAVPFAKNPFQPDYDWNTKWTPNYNGVNSYVEIPEWKPEGAFEIECDVYLSGNTLNQPVTSGSDGIKWGVLAGTWKVFGHDTGINSKQGFQTVSSGVRTYQQAHQGITRIGRGSDSNDIYLKGQISNLKLIDKVNPDNSRFYPGVIYSYVDPDATDVPMPSSTVLVDEWGDGSTNGIMYNFGTTQPHVPLLGDREEYVGDSTKEGTDWVRGVDSVPTQLRITRTSTTGRSGSYGINALTGGKIPSGSVLSSEGVNVVAINQISTSDIGVEGVGGTPFQHAFQYPNTFKVIKPTDPDYGDYNV